MTQQAGFEEQVIDFFTLMGHHIERIIKQSNTVSDLIITSNKGERWVARCQRTNIDDSVLRDFYKLLQNEKAMQATIITKRKVTPMARELAKDKPIFLLDEQQFQSYLQRAQNKQPIGTSTQSINSQRPIKQSNLKPNVQTTRVGFKKCPYCAEEIQTEAIICRYCGHNLIPAAKKKHQSKNKKSSNILLYLLLCLILMAFCGCISLIIIPSLLGPGASNINVENKSINIGETGKLYNGQGEIPVAITKDVLDQVIRASTRNDTLGYAELVMTGLVFHVPSGTKVLLIDSTWTARQVRILEGEYTGVTGWVPSDWVIK